MKLGSDKLDVIVVGAGPAGLSAAMWCAELGMSAAVLERSPVAGGQLHSIYNPIMNYLGHNARNGAELCRSFLNTFKAFGVPGEFGAEIVEINIGELAVTTTDKHRYATGFLIVASGVSRRQLNVPGERRLEEKGILISGARDGSSAAGKVAAVIGGGDAALENAVMLSEFASRVYVIHRGPELRARPAFIEKAAAAGNVEFILGSTVTSIDGHQAVEGVTVTNNAGKSVQIEAERVLIRIGVVPNSDLLRGKAELDHQGYVLVDGVGRTSADRVYAVGDVACPTSPTIATAAGMGATAAKHIRFLLDSNIAV